MKQSAYICFIIEAVEGRLETHSLKYTGNNTAVSAKILPFHGFFNDTVLLLSCCINLNRNGNIQSPYQKQVVEHSGISNNKSGSNDYPINYRPRSERYTIWFANRIRRSIHGILGKMNGLIELWI